MGHIGAGITWCSMEETPALTNHIPIEIYFSLQDRLRAFMLSSSPVMFEKWTYCNN